jgi:hypothetical protein
MLQRGTQLLLDGARMGTFLAEAKARNSSQACLYSGPTQQKLSAVAPYIFQYAHGTPFSNWYLHKGWGQSWGILVKSAWPLTELHKHFRKFMMVQTESGRSLYFRFYDPRVMRIFLPTCDTAQILEFFGQAIEYFIVEDEDPAFAIRYWHENGVLRSDRFAVADIISAIPEPEADKEEEDPLPPETIEALREQGILEMVLEARNEKIEDYEAPVAKKEPARVPVIATTAVAPQSDAKSTDSKPKTKWNMFD